MAALPTRCKFLLAGLPSSRKRELEPAANAERVLVRNLDITYGDVFQILLVSLLVDPGVDNLGLLRLQRCKLLRCQVRDFRLRLPVLRRPQMSAICSQALPISNSNSYSNLGRSSGVLLAGLSAFIVRNRNGSLSWLRGLSYCKRFHLFPTQPLVVKSTSKFRARGHGSPV